MLEQQPPREGKETTPTGSSVEINTQEEIGGVKSEPKHYAQSNMAVKHD